MSAWLFDVYTFLVLELKESVLHQTLLWRQGPEKCKCQTKCLMSNTFPWRHQQTRWVGPMSFKMVGHQKVYKVYGSGSLQLACECCVKLEFELAIVTSNGLRYLKSFSDMDWRQAEHGFSSFYAKYRGSLSYTVLSSKDFRKDPKKFEQQCKFWRLNIFWAAWNPWAERIQKIQKIIYVKSLSNAIFSWVQKFLSHKSL